MHPSAPEVRRAQGATLEAHKLQDQLQQGRASDRQGGDGDEDHVEGGEARVTHGVSADEWFRIKIVAFNFGHRKVSVDVKKRSLNSIW